MFYFRIDRVRFLDNGGIKSLLGVFGHDFAQVKTVDGGVGSETLGALRQAEKEPAKLLTALRVAREQYELRVAGRRENFWKGLVNRWDDSLDFARKVA